MVESFKIRHTTKTPKIKIAVNKASRIIHNAQYDNYIPLIRTDILYKNINIPRFEHVYLLFILKFFNYILYENETIFRNHMMPLSKKNIELFTLFIDITSNKTFAKKSLYIFFVNIMYFSCFYFESSIYPKSLMGWVHSTFSC